MQELNSFPLIIIGAGASGLMAATAALSEGARPLILEASPEAGLKLLLTGGGRCNLSNLLADPAIEDHYHGQANFLRPAMRVFPPRAVEEFFRSRGLPIVREEEFKLYPAEGGAQAVRQVFLDELKRSGVTIRYRERVREIRREKESFILCGTKESYRCQKCIIATGGASFPHTGSDGSALEMIRSLGIKTRPFTPALSSLIVKEPDLTPFSGISLRNCRLSLRDPLSPSPRRISDEGDILLTSFGLSGPPVLNLSRYFSDAEVNEAELDLLPGQSEEETLSELRKLAREEAKKSLKNLNWPALPARMRLLFLELADLDPESKAAHLSGSDLRAMNRLLRYFPLKISGVRGMRYAYLSRGGVLTDELDPRSLNLKKFPDLYICGELIDIDGDCGGFSLQLAFSTAYLAGKSAARRLREEISSGMLE